MPSPTYVSWLRSGFPGLRLRSGRLLTIGILSGILAFPYSPGPGVYSIFTSLIRYYSDNIYEFKN